MLQCKNLNLDLTTKAEYLLSYDPFVATEVEFSKLDYITVLTVLQEEISQEIDDILFDMNKYDEDEYEYLQKSKDYEKLQKIYSKIDKRVNSF